MDRSNDEEQDYESYSEDFDPDEEDQSDNNNNNQVIDESESENEIKVYKSLTGPSITIQPRPRKSKLKTPVKTESDGSLVKNSPRKPLPKFIPKIKKSVSMLGNVSHRSNVPLNPEKAETATSIDQSGKTTASTTDTKPPLKPNFRSKTTTLSKSISKFGLGFTTQTNPGTRRIPGSTNVTNRGYGRGNKYYGASPYFPPMKLGAAKAPGTVAQRVASAKRMTINDLKNKISQLMGEIEELKKEKRTMNHIQNRQNMALRKWEGKDAELPRLLDQHRDELRNSQSQLKKLSFQCRDAEEKLKMKNKKLLECETALKKLKDLVSREKLKDTQELEEDVEILSTNLIGAEKRLKEYMRHVEILNKNHLHQIAAEQQKIILANNHAGELRMEIAQLKIALRDKDRMLNYIQMRSNGRTLIKSYQEKERVQHTRYQFPTLESPNRTSSGRPDLSAGERAFLRSQMDRNRSQGDCIYDIQNLEPEKAVHHRSLTDKEGEERKRSGSGDLERDSNLSEIRGQDSISIDDSTKPNASKETKTRQTRRGASPQPSETEEQSNQTYYDLSQMLDSQNQPDSKSSLHPKATVSLKKSLPGTTDKIRKSKTEAIAKSKISKATVLEHRDEHNRKIKQSPHKDSKKVALKNENPESHNRSSTDRQVRFEDGIISSPKSKTSHKGLELRVKTPRNNVEIQNDSSSSSSSCSSMADSQSDESKQDEFPIKSSPPMAMPYVDLEGASANSHHPIKSGRDSSRRTDDKYVEGGDIVQRQRHDIGFESEPEEMMRYHEAAIGDFISASRTEDYLASARSLRSSSGHLRPKKCPPVVNFTTDDGSNPSSMIDLQVPSFSEIPVSQVYSSSIPSLSSPKQHTTEINEVGFFTGSPNYPVDLDSNYSNSAVQIQDPSFSRHQQQLSPRGANSYPQMTQNQNGYNGNGSNGPVHPQARGIFSKSDAVSSSRSSNQPMNLPFFSKIKESRPTELNQGYQRQANIHQTFRQGGDLHPQMYNSNADALNYNLKQHQLPNQKIPNQTQDRKSVYDPSFYSKLGTWK